MEYVFVSGIHGVGKSSLLGKLEHEGKFLCHSISDLIKKSGRNVDNKSKYTDKINENQDSWISQLETINLSDYEKLILDGHFCLLNTYGEVVGIPFETFNKTKMCKIVLMTTDENDIKERLEYRDNKLWDLNLIKKFQKCEVERAVEYSVLNSIPIFYFEKNTTIEELLKFLEK